ncbi:hypothetical protein ACWGI8_06570 [Streptomyces sp. NPDC054841]
MPTRQENLVQLELWFRAAAQSLPATHTEIIRPFTEWFIIRDARRRAARGRYSTKAAHTDRSEIRAAIEFMQWLDDHHLNLRSLTQADLEVWLAQAKPARPRLTAAFIRWTNKRGLTRNLEYPGYQRPAPATFLDDDDQADQLRRCLTDAALPLDQIIPPDPHGAIGLARFRRTLAWHVARRPGGLIALAIQYGHMRTVLDARTSSGYGTRSRHGIHSVLDVETALAAADTAARLRERTASGEKISGPAARRALTAAAQTPRFEGRIVPKTFTKKASAFLARDGVVLYYNPDAFLICAFKHDNALCEPEPGATAPRQYDCRPGCGNTVRTDTHARLLRERAVEIDQLVGHAPHPIGKRLRANANRLRATADAHDATAQPAQALT